jgi:hypothetical protein
MSREEEFVGSLTHSSSFFIYFLLFIIIKVCRVLFIKFIKTLIRNKKVKWDKVFPTKTLIFLSLSSDSQIL